MKKFLPGCLFLLFLTDVHAQSVSWLSTKGYSSIGFSLFVNDAFPLQQNNMITFEGSVDYFRHAVSTPLPLVGYRHLFTNKGYGFYIEPQIGYRFIASVVASLDSTKSLQSGAAGGLTQPLVSGPLIALATGYIFPGRLALNLSVRYEHVFTIGDTPIDMLSLRLTHTFICGAERYHLHYN